nr:MAG TPA: hypothetical protein [Caudoviricetes sp.]
MCLTFLILLQRYKEYLKYAIKNQIIFFALTSFGYNSRLDYIR